MSLWTSFHSTVVCHPLLEHKLGIYHLYSLSQSYFIMQLYQLSTYQLLLKFQLVAHRKTLSALGLKSPINVKRKEDQKVQILKMKMDRRTTVLAESFLHLQYSWALHSNVFSCFKFDYCCILVCILISWFEN